MTHENYMKLKFQFPQIMYWHTAILTPLLRASGCFAARMVALRRCDKDGMVEKPELFISGPLQKEFAHPCPKRCG